MRNANKKIATSMLRTYAIVDSIATQTERRAKLRKTSATHFSELFNVSVNFSGKHRVHSCRSNSSKSVRSDADEHCVPKCWPHARHVHVRPPPFIGADLDSSLIANIC